MTTLLLLHKHHRYIVQERKLQYFGHLIGGKGKQTPLMEGKIEGTRRRIKHRRTWTSDVTDWCSRNMLEWRK